MDGVALLALEADAIPPGLAEHAAGRAALGQ